MKTPVSKNAVALVSAVAIGLVAALAIRAIIKLPPIDDTDHAGA